MIDLSIAHLGETNWLLQTMSFKFNCQFGICLSNMFIKMLTHLKGNLYKTIIMLVMLYGADPCTVTRNLTRILCIL